MVGSWLLLLQGAAAHLCCWWSFEIWVPCSVPAEGHPHQAEHWESPPQGKSRGNEKLVGNAFPRALRLLEESSGVSWGCSPPCVIFFCSSGPPYPPQQDVCSRYREEKAAHTERKGLAGFHSWQVVTPRCLSSACRGPWLRASWNQPWELSGLSVLSLWVEAQKARARGSGMQWVGCAPWHLLLVP